MNLLQQVRLKHQKMVMMKMRQQMCLRRLFDLDSQPPVDEMNSKSIQIMSEREQIN